MPVSAKTEKIQFPFPPRDGSTKKKKKKLEPWKINKKQQKKIFKLIQFYKMPILFWQYILYFHGIFVCESFHSHFNGQFYLANPSIFSLLKILKHHVQTDTFIKINSVNMNIKNVNKSKIVTNTSRLEKIEKAIQIYEKNKICEYTFVRRFLFHYAI